MTNIAAVSGDDQINLLDLLQVVADNLRLLLIAPLILGLLALGIAFAISPTFTATTRFMPPQQQQSGAALMLQSLGSLGGLAGVATGLKSPGDQIVAFLKSESVSNALIDRFKLIERYEAELKTDARRRLESDSNIAFGKDGFITVAVDDKDPVFAAQMANGFVEEVSKLLNRLAVTEAQQRRAFFEIQLLQTKNNLVKAELALKSSGVSSSALKSNPDITVRAVAVLQAQISAQEVKLASMRSYLTDTAPDFMHARAELAALRAQLSKFENSSQLTTNAADDSDYVTRYRDFKYYETLFELFAKQFELAKIDEAREGSIIQVVDVALPPERKSKPKRAMIAVATTLISGFLLLMILFMRQSLRIARRDPVASEKVSRLQSAFRQALGRK